LSNVACVLQCGGIWIGGKGWGVTWKLVQAVVKPKEVVSVFGKCHIKLSEDEKNTIENHDIEAEEEVNSVPAPVSTMVEDSDDEEKPEPVPAPAPAPAVAKPVVKVAVAEKPAEKPAAAEEAPAPEKKVVKKVVKKATA
jgi:hypothetical protein